MNESIRGELYPVGGSGTFLLGRAEALAPRLAEEYAEKVDLIYLDPPFGTGDAFSVKLASQKERLTIPAYDDRLTRADYLEMMRTVLSAAHRMLSPSGSLYLHIDYRMSAHLRLLLDDIFGEGNFMNEIVWEYKSGGRSTRHFSRKHDTILFYRKSKAVYFDPYAVGIPRGAQKRNNMKRTVDEQGRICFSIRSGGKTYTYYEDTPIFPSDVWDDIEHLHQRDPERTGFRTQKPEALLRRIINASTEKGALVCDLFSGSGTTAAVAAKLGRRFLAVDASPVAMQVLRRRQLMGQSEPDMFGGAHAMRFCYDAPPLTDLPVQAHTLEQNGVRKLVYGGCGTTELAYLAVGHFDAEGYFRPHAYALTPAAGATLPIAEDIPLASAAIHACDHAGNMAFLPFENIPMLLSR